MRYAHDLCDQYRDVATASVLENLIDEAERRTWFLYEASRRGDPTGHSAPALRAGQRGSRSVAAHSIMDTRRDQMFPVLEPAEIERLRRFGEMRSYGPGEALAQVGDAGHGLTIILAGKVDITQHQGSGPVPITTHEAGGFMGELAQLSGRPSLVDATAQEPVEALIIPPDRLRALLIAGAELGERIMRALILRRVGLIERGTGGPVIVGHAGSADVLRLAGFLGRNGHPHQSLDADVDPEAQALVERFQVDPGQLP